MDNGLGGFVVKFLKEKTETRKIIKCDDFFQLLNDMGLSDDDNEVVNIIDYLDSNNTDINFHGAKTQNYYNRFRNIERKVQLSKLLKGSKSEVQKLIEEVDKIKVPERPDWLEMYRDDDDNSDFKVSEQGNQYQRITDMLTKELKDKVENEPGITLEETQREVDNEINGDITGEGF
jgi:hypothetical protein